MIIASSYVGIFSPSGKPISLYLLRYSVIAVDDHSFIRCASFIQQPRLVNKPGLSNLYAKVIRMHIQKGIQGKIYAVPQLLALLNTLTKF